MQVNARNRFSGCVRIHHGEHLGVLFFRDGDVVHAEQAGQVGEDALVDILQWQQGRFTVEQNVVTARRTIEKSCEHLLLDAHRRLDERQAGRGEALRAPPPTPERRMSDRQHPESVVEKLRAVQGVEEAILVSSDGQRLGEHSYASDRLAGQAAYLAMACAELGGLLQGGEIRFASVEGTDRHLLLYASKSQYFLGVLLTADAEVGAVDAAIRHALAK